jgi:hypothetical protein
VITDVYLGAGLNELTLLLARIFRSRFPTPRLLRAIEELAKAA